MRIFETLEEAASEIERDIAKGPIVTSSRVQNIIQNADLHEVLDYSYSVRDIPHFASEIASLGWKLGFWKADQISPMIDWLNLEMFNRVRWIPGSISEGLHPHLNELLTEQVRGSGEENVLVEPDYTYTDRLRGSIEVVGSTLSKFPDSRRGFWPIYQPEDSVRSARVTRIPCSLGYQALIRWLDKGYGPTPYLHLTYMERACDFKKFWLTDLWFARQWQLELIKYIKHHASWPSFNNLTCGNTTHFITSLHSFVTEEVY